MANWLNNWQLSINTASKYQSGTQFAVVQNGIGI
jgi:hypothetical protein